MSDDLSGPTADADEPNWFDVIAEVGSEAWYRTAQINRLSTAARIRRWRVADHSADELALASALVATGLEGFAISVEIVVEAALRPTPNLCAMRLEMTPSSGGTTVLADAIASPWNGRVSVSGDVRGYNAGVTKAPGGWKLEVLGEAFDTGPMEFVMHLWPAVGTKESLFDPACTGEVIVRSPTVTLLTLEEATRRRYAMYESVGATG